MIIYQNTTNNFINDIKENLLTDVLVGNFESRYGRKPNLREIYSWQNSLPRVRDLIELSAIQDNYIILEYEVPYNQSRIDCLLFGKDLKSNQNVFLIELKQWMDVEALEINGNFVETYTGGHNKTVPHPSQQIEGYSNYLKDFVKEFSTENPLQLFSCVYCHNYPKQSNGLFSERYDEVVGSYPVYCKEDTRKLAEKIKELLSEGDGFQIFNRFMQSTLEPSKKLTDKAHEVIVGNSKYSLLNEQLIAKNVINSKIRKLEKENTKSVIIIRGGPGTGKSVIAINLLADWALKRKKIFYACKSKPFLSAIKNNVGREAELLFSNLYRFVPSRVKENEIDIVLVDEAHRIEKTSNFQYTKKTDRTDMPQIEQIIRTAKISIFFIDDKQNVRFKEVGSIQLIKDTAIKYNATVDEVVLETQFRCMGSNNYIEWLESVLGYTNERKMLMKNDLFEFKIFDSPESIFKILEKKEKKKPNSARMVAGYCWPWSNPTPDGELVNDVVIGDFKKPWEAKDLPFLKRGIPKWYEWAYKTEAFNQIGCIYTSQGFEFDYVGVIIGRDLTHDQKTQTLKGDVFENADPTLKHSQENFDKYVKNIYRVLLSRAMKGCYVYFVDKETEKFFRSRMES